MADAKPALVRDPVFTALTRPQMFAGVTYTYFIINGMITMEAFLITKSFLVLPLAGLLHLLGSLACMREPRIFDLWIIRASRCPRIRNFAAWRQNSYRP